MDPLTYSLDCISPEQDMMQPAGSGRITVGSRGSDVALSELMSAYPLKLLSPRAVQNKVAVVYVLTYGGGLVGGDQLKLQADLEHGSILVLLSQGSTKVFKTRSGHRLASVSRPSATLLGPASNLTSQTFSFNVASGSTLALLMEPVTCFRSASYSQVQTFRLQDEQSSLVVIDWITSGRKAIGEEWSFSRYYSCNEIWVGQQRIMRDVVLLEDDCEHRVANRDPGLPARALLERMAPYGCYATVFFYGPNVTNTINHITKECEGVSVFKERRPEKLLWSVSPVTPKEQTGAVLRVAALETEMVKKWLSNALCGLEKVIGADIYQRAFA